MTLLGVVPTLALAVASTRRSRGSGRRSLLWVFAFTALTAVFSILITGIGIPANGGLGMTHPTSASVVSFLLWGCLAVLLATPLVSIFDPRVGVAAIVVTVPVVVYRLAVLVAVESKPTGAVVLTLWAFATATAVAVISATSSRRPQLA